MWMKITEIKSEERERGRKREAMSAGAAAQYLKAARLNKSVK